MLYVMLFGHYPFEVQSPGQKIEAQTRIRTMMDRIINMQVSAYIRHKAAAQRQAHGAPRTLQAPAQAPPQSLVSPVS